MPAEDWLLDIGLVLYLMAAALSLLTAANCRSDYRPILLVGALALAAHTLAIGMRWVRLEHGPYVDLYEILSSNVWSLHVAVFGACLTVPRIRPALATALPILQVLVLWSWMVAPVDGHLPVTYDTVWLAVHVWLGKGFLGCAIVAVAIGLTVLARHARIERPFSTMPTNSVLDELVFRLMLVAFAFHSGMLIAGAVWARGAWGRFWAWDPLETWAFLTWMAIAGFLHLRLVKRPSPIRSAIIAAGIFVLAFATFFGIPFISIAPHKGVI